MGDSIQTQIDGMVQLAADYWTESITGLICDVEAEHIGRIEEMETALKVAINLIREWRHRDVSGSYLPPTFDECDESWGCYCRTNPRMVVVCKAIDAIQQKEG